MKINNSFHVTVDEPCQFCLFVDLCRHAQTKLNSPTRQASGMLCMLKHAPSYVHTYAAEAPRIVHGRLCVLAWAVHATGVSKSHKVGLGVRMCGSAG